MKGSCYQVWPAHPLGLEQNLWIHTSKPGNRLLPKSGPGDANGQAAATQLLWREPGSPRRVGGETSPAVKEKQLGGAKQKPAKGVCADFFWPHTSLRTGTAQHVMERPWGMKAESTRNNHVCLRSPELRNRDMEQLLLGQSKVSSYCRNLRCCWSSSTLCTLCKQELHKAHAHFLLQTGIWPIISLKSHYSARKNNPVSYEHFPCGCALFPYLFLYSACVLSNCLKSQSLTIPRLFVAKARGNQWKHRKWESGAC